MDTTLMTPSATLPSFTTNHELKPNPHPYAIKTTSSALLSRSNSSHRTPQDTRHHYVPLSPTPTKANDSNGKNGNANGRKHRYSKSFSSDSTFPPPAPLPVPPTFRSASPNRSSWTDLVDNTGLQESTMAKFTGALSSSGIEGDDLPSNPKLWTPTQLSTYLSTALYALTMPDDTRDAAATNGVTVTYETDDANIGTIPPDDAASIAAFVRERDITGRLFLRFTTFDLESFGISQNWKSALLVASRNLRQNVLRGRIWVDSSSPTQTHPFSSELYNSSTSSVDLSVPVTPPTRQQRDLARMRRKAGRVKGLVESWERSSISSCSSVSSSDVESDVEPAGQHRSPTRQPVPLPEPEPLCQDDTAALRASDEEEPSIEELLRDSPPDSLADIRGARAWEVDLNMGDTVKPVRSASPTKIELSFGRGSGHGKGKRVSRVVTAIFRGSDTSQSTKECEEGDANAGVLEGGVVESSEIVTDSRSSYSAVPLNEPPPAGKPKGTETQQIATLSSEISSTRTLLDNFRARLETVERQIQELEAHAAKQDEEPCLHADLSASISSASQSTQTDTPAAPPIAQIPDESLFSLICPSSLLARAISYIYAAPRPAILSLPRASRESRSRSLHRSRREHRPRDDEPTTIAALPSYVLVVSIGVCAVVLRVLLRRLGARRILKA